VSVFRFQLSRQLKNGRFDRTENFIKMTSIFMKFIRTIKNYKYQITNIKQITMTEIQKSKRCLICEGFGHM